MYTPAHFAEDRPEVLQAFIDAHPLGTLVTLTPAGLDANLIPFEFDPTPSALGPHGTLRAHVARANPVWRDLATEVEALVVFQGPQAYVTPSWYVETKPATGKVVPTWNYCVVHAHGPLRAIDDRDWLRGQVERLVRRHESSRPTPWHVSDAPADYIEKQLAAIVGIEIPLTRLSGKWKTSQNRPVADQTGVVTGLLSEENTSAQTMGKIMRKNA